MTIRILSDELLDNISLQPRLLTPARAELHIFLTLRENVAAEIRGRLMGPTCPYAETIEVAYHVKPLPRESEANGNVLAGRILIPEPSLWDPESPFLYSGPVELWSGGKRVARAEMSCGLRVFQLSENELRWNGKPLQIAATHFHDDSAKTAQQMRSCGYNTIITESAEVDSACAFGARFGFLVLLRATDDAVDEALASRVQEHCCFVGYLEQPADTFIPSSLQILDHIRPVSLP